LLSVCSECPDGFSQTANSCYRVVNDSLPWSIAALRCQSLHHNAHLVTIDNQLEQDDVADFVREQFESETRNIFYSYYFVLFALVQNIHSVLFKISSVFILSASSSVLLW